MNSALKMRREMLLNWCQIVIKLKTIWIFIMLLLLLQLALIETQNLEIDYSGHIEIEAISGKSVSLPCNITLTHGNSREVALILWYKGDTGIPVYTVDIRNKSSLSGSVHLPSSSYKSRSHFEMNKSPPTLRIDKVDSKDSGQYRCRVDYEKYPTQNFLINLTVIVAPESVYIVNTDTMEKLEGLVGPFNESTDLNLSCESYGGIPRPTLSWWKDDKPLIASYEILSNELTRSDLTLTNLSRFHLLSKITCKASNNLLIEPIQATITINLNLKPSTISIEFPSKVISTGKRSELICRVSGSRPPARIYWWLDGRRLTRSRDTISKDGNETISVLSFTGTASDNGKELICQAENPLMKNSSLEESIRLNIHYVPLVNIVLGAKIDRDSIREGSDVYFECIIESNPWISEVTWIFNGSPLMSQPSQGIIISNQSLVLQKVKRTNRGYYSCSALNSQGIGSSDTFYLKVLFTPVCKPSQEVKFGVARNEMVNISCHVDADPEDVKFHWMLNNSLETVEIRSFSSNGSTSIVSYVPKYKNSYGILLCWGSNRVGVQTEPCSFNVIPASPPDAVSNCTIRNQTLDSFSVSCSPGDSGGLTQIFFLEVYNSDIQKLHWSTASQVPSFYVNSLPSSTRFTLNIYANNKKGRSPSVSLTTYTLTLPHKEAKKQESSESSFHPIIGILIGIIITSLLIMFGIMICIKIRSDTNIDKDNSGKSICSTSCMLDDDHHHGGSAESRKGPTDFDKIDNSMDPYQELNKASYDTLDSGFNINLMKPITNKISYKDPLDKMITSTGLVTSNSSDVTYAELSLFSCDSNNSGTISRRRINKLLEPTEYASIEYSPSFTPVANHNQNHNNNINNNNNSSHIDNTFDCLGKHQHHLTYDYINGNKLDNRQQCTVTTMVNNNNHNMINNNVNSGSTMETETEEMMLGTRTATSNTMQHPNSASTGTGIATATSAATTLTRDHSMADGCSETEVSIETPLIESLKPGYRSHDIIIRKVSSNDLRIATPV